ncbi:MAG: ribosomal L7Ae/L30e/S12e/Gadd45 family protein [Acidaminococcaceae bacterium]|nr:ribosomal L7Ae/L30e/S12e/Gadd45 family protein [Acidaminococcaceae bacterium]
MSLDDLKTAVAKVVGVKQTAKALQKQTASGVYIAADAEERITAPIKAECEKQNVDCLVVESMQVLGKACGIHAGASAAAILKN